MPDGINTFSQRLLPPARRRIITPIDLGPARVLKRIEGTTNPLVPREIEKIKSLVIFENSQKFIEKISSQILELVDEISILTTDETGFFQAIRETDCYGNTAHIADIRRALKNSLVLIDPSRKFLHKITTKNIIQLEKIGGNTENLVVGAQELLSISQEATLRMLSLQAPQNIN